MLSDSAPLELYLVEAYDSCVTVKLQRSEITTSGQSPEPIHDVVRALKGRNTPAIDSLNAPVDKLLLSELNKSEPQHDISASIP